MLRFQELEETLKLPFDEFCEAVDRSNFSYDDLKRMLYQKHATYDRAHYIVTQTKAGFPKRKSLIATMKNQTPLALDLLKGSDDKQVVAGAALYLQAWREIQLFDVLHERDEPELARYVLEQLLTRKFWNGEFGAAWSHLWGMYNNSENSMSETVAKRVVKQRRNLPSSTVQAAKKVLQANDNPAAILAQMNNVTQDDVTEVVRSGKADLIIRLLSRKADLFNREAIDLLREDERITVIRGVLEKIEALTADDIVYMWDRMKRKMENKERHVVTYCFAQHASTPDSVLSEIATKSSGTVTRNPNASEQTLEKAFRQNNYNAKYIMRRVDVSAKFLIDVALRSNSSDFVVACMKNTQLTKDDRAALLEKAYPTLETAGRKVSILDAYIKAKGVTKQEYDTAFTMFTELDERPTNIMPLQSFVKSKHVTKDVWLYFFEYADGHPTLMEALAGSKAFQNEHAETFMFFPEKRVIKKFVRNTKVDADLRAIAEVAA